MYKQLASHYGVKWHGRNYNHSEWSSADVPNRCLSAATACLYGLVEAAVLAAGYAPAVGFIHTGKPLSFVYDIADIYKFETVVPVAFAVAAKEYDQAEREVRLRCRDSFRKTRLLERVILDIEAILDAAEVERPAVEGVVDTAIPNPESMGDAGHRS